MGGVVFSQAAHQIDVLRRLVPSPVVGVRASTGIWDGWRPTEGAYQVFLSFEDGASAVLTYSGYGRYDTDALMGWIGETGTARDPDDYAAARLRLFGADEGDLKAGRAYGARETGAVAPVGHEHFGFWLVNCERGDLRLTAAGVETYGQTERATIEAPLDPATRRGVIDEIWGVVAEGRAPLHSAAWGRANLAVCLAILKSAAEGREIAVG
jgi:phthalate 4,5-cis-dihydrodiol dehydrogenase